MSFNVAPEFTAMVIAGIILVYARDPSEVPTLRNRLFRMCLYAVVVYGLNTLITNYVSTRFTQFPALVLQLVNIIQFILNPLLAMLFTFYVAAAVWEDDPRVRRRLTAAAAPMIVYALFVIANPFTHLMFAYVPVQGFVPGPGFFLSYALSAYYFAWMAFVLIRSRRTTDLQFRRVLLSIPLLGLVLVGLMLLQPGVLLTGTAATSLLLIIYLYLQNKRIYIDDLTGLQNRKAFSKKVEYDLARRTPFDVVLFSLDDFGIINDKFGQASGDALLGAFSEHVKTVAGARRVYRYSGDELAVILEAGEHPAREHVIEQVRDRLKELWVFGDKASPLQASVAVTSHPEHASTLEDVISLLEDCVAQSKRGGKGKLVVADAPAMERIRRHRRVLEAVREALRDDRFAVHYQPIYSVQQGGRVVAAEALARLHDRELGDVSPAEFVPVAEGAGLIADLGRAVLEQVCQYVAELDRAGIELKVSVNFSVGQFFQADLAQAVMMLVDRSGVDPTRISIEITESVFAEQAEYVRHVMSELGERGVEFHLDDFGTGYSNLAQVIELPFSMVKMDRSLIRNAAESVRSLGVLDALTSAFQKSGIEVTIEGVETDVQLEIVRRIGAGYVQGFLFERPMPGDDLTQLLQAPTARWDVTPV